MHQTDVQGAQAKGVSPMTLNLTTPSTVRAICVNKLGMTSAVKSERYLLDDKSPGTPVMAGVGLLIEQEDGSDDVVVTEVKSGGAAGKEGSVKAGDMLLSVDGRPVAGMHMPYIFKIVAGPLGSTVTLGLRRSLFLKLTDTVHPSMQAHGAGAACTLSTPRSVSPLRW